jgi:predicted amidohydrolase
MKIVKTIRFGVAQIPVTPFQQRNIETIKKAIDWAAENKVDYLVTPEASLSGYSTSYYRDLEFLNSGLHEIEMYAISKNVGLCLGTLWVEYNEPGHEQKLVKRNQIRFYTKEGRFLGSTNKQVLTPLDLEIGIVKGEGLAGVLIPFEDKVIPVAGLICADLYGHLSNYGGLPQQYFTMGAKLLIHSTNAERGLDKFKDKLEDQWLEANITRISYLLFPVISADNSYTMSGEPYTGKTITQSGFCIDGKWVNKVPRTGTQYSYYDFDIKKIAIDLADLPKSELS